jgi:hypothetical protein
VKLIQSSHSGDRKQKSQVKTLVKSHRKLNAVGEGTYGKMWHISFVLLSILKLGTVLKQIYQQKMKLS